MILIKSFFPLVFCAGRRARDKQTLDAFQSSALTRVRLWIVITLQTLASWQSGGQLPILSFWLSENCRRIFLLENVSPNVQNLGLETPILGKLNSKKFYHPYFLCRKFCVSASWPPTFLLTAWLVPETVDRV